MCIAVYKPQGQKMPSKKIFSNCFSSNDDGAGFMFPYNGKVHYEKGFMSFTSFKKALKKAIKNYGLNTKDIPMVFHFRITSQGGIRPELTHPFPLSRSYDEMRKLSGDVDVACVHNGIIDFASSYNHNIDYSDTMEFDREVLFPLINKNPKYYENKTLMGLLEYLLSGNRFAIMDGNGHVELIGSWNEDKGIYYSNNSYKAIKSSFKSVKTISTTSLFDDDMSYMSKYGYGYDDTDPYDDYYYCGYITKEQEKVFLEDGILMDEFGEEMTIQYVESEKCCIAFSVNGLSYKLSDAAEDYAYEHGLVFYEDDDELDSWNRSFGVSYEGAK